jgi:hypothetical protein
MSYLTLSVFEGTFGSWGSPVLADAGCHVTGLSVRYESPIGSGDDTALNGLKMETSPFPGLGSNSEPEVLTVDNGYWGTWRPMVHVPPGFYIIGMSVRNEAGQGGGDDTCMNGIRLICKKCNGPTIQQVTVWEGNWGDWGADVMVPSGYYIAGFRCRVEPPQGNGDDTAMNGIRMLLRPYA